MGKTVVLFPLPLQGHQTPMLQLATILYSKGFSVSVIHTQFNAPNTAIHPYFTFHPIPDSLLDHDPFKEGMVAFLTKLNVLFVESFKNLLAEILSEKAANQEPVACLITDVMSYFTQDIADDLSLPRIVLRTCNAANFHALLCFPIFQERGYHYATGSQLEAEVPEISPLKVKDIPILNISDPEAAYELTNVTVEKTKASRGLIINTFQELEGDSLSMIREKIPTPVFAIGPFHKLAPLCIDSRSKPDQSCISWLNAQPPKSVIYVSFGSIVTINTQEFLEVAWGLANSNQPFLWVIRPGLVRLSNEDGHDPLPNGFMEMVAERGRIVNWAPQKEVLAHPAIGGFWTHSGWNSTLESISEGVPMLCLPCFGDQMTNARYVTDVWRIGFWLQNEVKRDGVEKAIKTLMVDEEGEEMRQKVTYLKDKAILSNAAGGCSYSSLETLVSLILSF